MGNTTVANTSGTINSQVRANTTYGQSIVTYTGTGSNATVGHGLSSAPEVILIKNRSVDSAWMAWNNTFAGNELMLFNNTNAKIQTLKTEIKKLNKDKLELELEGGRQTQLKNKKVDEIEAIIKETKTKILKQLKIAKIGYLIYQHLDLKRI